MIDDVAKRQFQQIIWGFYREHGRHELPWRQPEVTGEFDPYKIMVSEIMLQQTQVPRVITKYQEFLLLFPDLQTLAAAEQGEVIRAWSGLGYNRRAKFLHQAAKVIQDKCEGAFPHTQENLIVLPGVGKNTAGAILAYAFNEPVEFIETNIRTVYIHHFFDDQEKIEDTKILNMLSNTLDRENPREWYWALMDYGSYLKKSGVRRNHQSKHYSKQSIFEGSKRQIRGQVLRALAEEPQTLEQLSENIRDDRLQNVINELLKEGLIQKKDDSFRL